MDHLTSFHHMNSAMTVICAHCRQAFSLDALDMAFYHDIAPSFGGRRTSIPAPTHCPDCRCQRRLAWRNEKSLYRRQCSFSGKPILSIYAPEKPFAVYDAEVWMSDAWDPMHYGRSIDWQRSFFDQWQDLHQVVPLPSFNMRFQNENSDYTNLSSYNKNCYLIFAASYNEDSYYGTYLHRNHQAVDCFFVFDAESCYECIDCYGCSQLAYAQYCRNCSDSYFLRHCQGCHHCIGCANLVNKSYHINNIPCTKDAFDALRDNILRSREAWQDAEEALAVLDRTLVHKYIEGFSNADVSGDHLFSCKNVKDSFDVTFSEDCRYCVWMNQAKNCYDCYGWGLTGELGLENHLTGNGFYQVLFSESCWNSVSNLLYCRYCLDGSRDLFGCIGLRHARYCIFNKQYTQVEYEDLAPRLIEKMKTMGEWGEFFPARLSPYGYNETVAQEYFPLSEKDVLARGWNWKEEGAAAPSTGKSIAGEELPHDIRSVPDDVLEWTIRCAATGKPFRLTQQELTFHRSFNLPLPRCCFDERHRRRMQLRNPRKLWSRKCGKCQAPIQTSYAPEHLTIRGSEEPSGSRREIVVCEACYLKEVY